MHDIQHVHYPEFFSWTRRLNRKITYGLSAQYASFIQASSQFIKDDLLASFPGISPRHIEVIPEGVNAPEFSAPVDGAQLDNYYLPDKFLFCPAQLWPHKNHITILRALKVIEAEHNLKIPLVLTGAKYSAAPDIFKFVAQQSMNYVFYLGKVPFKDLVALYQRAAFLITAVLYESSSLPVLEAAAAGTPIIASNIRPNQELAEVLQLNLFSPLDVEDAARLIFSLWTDEMNVSAQVRHNQQHILKYSWESVARKYLRFFRRIAAS
jgi:glycosyltransferase involved in cell wall biosynthesis